MGEKGIKINELESDLHSKENSFLFREKQLEDEVINVNNKMKTMEYNLTQRLIKLEEEVQTKDEVLAAINQKNEFMFQQRKDEESKLKKSNRNDISKIFIGLADSQKEKEIHVERTKALEEKYTILADELTKSLKKPESVSAVCTCDNSQYILKYIKNIEMIFPLCAFSMDIPILSSRPNPP